MDPGFSPTRLSLLDRGFVYAIAHIRGGGDLGETWKNAGKLHDKMNSFTDFIACAERLVEAGYTCPERLAIMGGSAGGLLMGAVVNMRPDLFHAAVAQVPFVDVLSTMQDPTLPLTVIEYDEWGNPEHRAYYETIRAYSPYDNVRAQAYPHLLIVAGLNDPRVQYWEPAKWCAKLRATKTDDNLLLLKTHMGAGHAGVSGRYEALKDLAFDYAFVLDRLGFSK
ncbi:prolyl oligopeptidase family serine peptidase [Alkalilimnicola ehrlichii]|uniref:prolyl oligopeptidase family serine peptidase n=1 Tax=Alkalilimnicola ehrlichii TaxID=351052 RepID=UPI00384B691D